MAARIGIAVLTLFFVTVLAQAGDWPQFRGPQGEGRAAGDGYPTEWDSSKNVKWKTALPDRGNSSPIVSRGRLFVTCAEDDGKTRSLICLDRADGRQLWMRSVRYDKEDPTHSTNPQGSATPVTDGRRVVVWYGSAGLHCYDFSGQPLWERDLGEFTHIWGYGSSPILLDDRVIINCGPGKRVFLSALDLNTGKTLWETDEPHKGDGSYNENRKYMGSWCTPSVIEVDGKQQIVCAMPTRVVGYDPDTGEIIWTCDGIRGPKGDLAYGCLMFGDDLAVVYGGYHGPSMGFRLGGFGNVTRTHRLWRVEKSQQSIGTGVIVGPYVYNAHAGPGTLQCIEAATGEEQWEKDAPGGNHWGSVILAGGRFYVTNQQGATHVFLPDPTKLVMVATNDLGERSNSTPAFSDGEIFLRTFKGVYCIANAAADVPAR